MTVSEAEIAAGDAALTSADTHNVAEGAGAAPLAALLQESGRRWSGRRVGLVLSGGNVDRDVYARCWPRDDCSRGEKGIALDADGRD